MNRQTFFKILTHEIKGLPSDEQKNALDYYTEYFNECENPDTAIQNIAHPREIARNLYQEFGIEQKTKPGYTPLTIVGLILLAILVGPFLLGMFVALFSIIVIVPASFIFATASTSIASFLILIPATLESPINFLSFLGLSLLSFGLCLLCIKITKYTLTFTIMLCKKTFLLIRGY